MTSSISLSMIVRNEASHLKRAIDSASPWVDEVVVIDTGSDDDTVEVAKSAGATVLEYPWEGFSSSRNRAIEICSADWILVLDADEELEKAAGPRLKEMTRRNEPIGYLFRQRNYLPGLAPVDTPVVRLFPRHDDIRFSGVLHEKIVCDLLDYKQVHTGLLIHHWGFEASQDPFSEKSMRYEQILRQALLDQPEDSESLMHLGLIFSRRGAFTEAISLLSLSRNTAHEGAVYMPMLLLALSECNYETGSINDALYNCKEGLSLAPDFPPLLYNLGLCYWRLNNLKQAQIYATKAINACKSYRGILPVDGQVGNTLAPRLLAACRSRK